MKQAIAIILVTILLTSCSTMNSNFSCNKTAGDSCLTIEEVDAMTSFADDYQPRKSSQLSQIKQSDVPKSLAAYLKKRSG